MPLYNKWKKSDDFSKGESIPSVIKRCPSCKKLTLEFDPSNSKIRCTSCGFEESLPVMK